MAVIEPRVRVKNGKTITKWRAKVRLKGFPPESRTFDRKTDADKWAGNREYELRHTQAFGFNYGNTKTLKDVLDRYCDALQQINPRRHQEVKPMLAYWIGQLGHTKLSGLTTDAIMVQRELLKTRRRRGQETVSLSNGRVNRIVAALSCALSVAMDEWQWITRNPALVIKPLPEPKGRTRFLQTGELAKLLIAADHSENEDMTAIVLLALTTGARRGEIQKIQIAHVDVESETILLPVTKNGRPRMLYLVEPARSAVMKVIQRQRKSQTYLFASPHDPAQPNDFRTAWESVRLKADLSDFRFHDLRHSAASLLAKHGAQLAQISVILGHSSFQVTKRYTHLLDSDIADVLKERLQRFSLMPTPPDKNDDAYHYLHDLSLEGWAWEFIRRGQPYRDAYAAVQDSGAEIVAHVPEKVADESEVHWRYRAEGQGVIPRSLTKSMLTARAWRLMDMYAPTLAFDPSIIRFDIVNPFPAFFVNVPDGDEKFILDTKSVPDEAKHQFLKLRPIEDLGVSPDLVIDKNVMIVALDIRQSLKHQIEKMKDMLAAYSKLVDKCLPQGRMRSQEWERHIRMLDAVEAGMDQSSAIEKIHPEKNWWDADEKRHLSYNEAGPGQVTGFASDRMAAAIEMTQNGFRTILDNAFLKN